MKERMAASLKRNEVSPARDLRASEVTLFFNKSVGVGSHNIFAGRDHSGFY